MPHRKELPIGHIIAALDATGGHRGAAAKLLRVSPATLRRRMQELELNSGPHRYTWDLNLWQRMSHRVQERTLLDGLRGDYYPATRVLRTTDWGQDGINEPELMSDAEVSQMLADWKTLPGYRYAYSANAAASGARNAQRGRTQKHRPASKGYRSAGRTTGTP